MKYTENDPRLPQWLNDLLNSYPLLLDSDQIKPRFTLIVGCKDPVTQKWNWPKVRFGRSEFDTHLFWNAMLFIRVLSPFCLVLQIRWNGSESDKALYQRVIGWKMNGRFAITARIQSDSTAAEVHVPGGSANNDQAHGWDCGPH